MLIPDDPDERQTYALRIVAQRCLYGVDKNPLAAEMAKLSLWLLTLAKDKPFEFLDHAIRCGDSLSASTTWTNYGISTSTPRARITVFSCNSSIKSQGGDRSAPQIDDMPANTVEDVEAQERLLARGQRED